MRKKTLAVALMVGGIALGCTGVASAERYGPFAGEDSEKLCKLEKMRYQGSGDCFEDPPGGGQWFFDAPQQPENPYK
ncbi:hypothetical protein [Nocardia wallacei]|uniref:hypothetical protein n=1 Tax=Nocardia wallacei TaxID=480035 RepID=UPI0024555151|nr:hypothetical protein [Nocardia wallacei]